MIALTKHKTIAYFVITHENHVITKCQKPTIIDYFAKKSVLNTVCLRVKPIKRSNTGPIS